MDLSEIQKLIRLMLRADLSELEFDDSKRGLRVHLKRDKERGHEPGLANLVQVMPTPVAASTATGAVAPGTAPGSNGPPPGTEIFKSPIVGTFYRAASPDAEPFVSPGSAFAEGAVLCIIEAMKVMNEIRSEFRGEVVEVLAGNGEPVEFGQPLFLIKKS